MDTALLSKTAAAMVAKGKGILAADESSGTCESRFKSVGVECTEENRRTYRGLLFTTPGVEQYISGVILFDETIRQKANDGVLFPQYLSKKGIIPGIKVDAGAKSLPLHAGEKVLDPEVARPAPLPGERSRRLTPRELEVLQLICDGLSNKEIAAKLDVSANTVAVHRANIMNALGVHKTAELVVYALQNGLVNPL